MIVDKQLGSFKGNLFYNVIKYSATVVFPTLLFAYVSRILLPDGVGKINAAKTFGNYFSLVASFGITSYGVREVAKNRNDKKNRDHIASELIYLNIVTSIVTTAIYIVVIYFFTPQKIVFSLLLCNILMIVFTGIAFDWFFYGIENIKYIAIRTVSLQIIGFLATIVFVKNQSDLVKYYVIYMLTTFGYCILNVPCLLKQVKIALKDCNIQKHIFPAFRHLIMVAIGSINFDVDISYINYYMSDSDVGIYTVGHKVIYMIILLIGSGLGVVVTSRISYIFHNNRCEYQSFAATVFNVFLLFGVPCFFGVLCVNREIVIAFSGYAFEDSQKIAMILSIVILFTSISNGLKNTVIIPAEMDTILMGICITTITINVIGNYLFINRFGLAGVACCTILSELITMVLYIVFSGRKVDISKFFSKSWQYPIASVTIPFIAIPLRIVVKNAMIYLFIVVIIAATAYFSLLYLMKNTLIVNTVKRIKTRL